MRNKIDTAELYFKKALAESAETLAFPRARFLTLDNIDQFDAEASKFTEVYPKFYKWINSAKNIVHSDLIKEDPHILEEATLDSTFTGSINMSNHVRSVDNVLTYIFLKNLLTIPKTTKAYKLGLIDDRGSLVREPVTEEENLCISNLDLLCHTIRTWIRPYLSRLAKMSWLRSADPGYRVQNAFSGHKFLAKRATILRANKELDKILMPGKIK